MAVVNRIERISPCCSEEIFRGAACLLQGMRLLLIAFQPRS